MQINKYIDHTLLKATATKADIVKLCNEAKKYNFYAVCVNGCYVELVAKELKGSDVKIAAVVGFPLGAMTTKAKIFEAKECIKNGASEIDMVINIGKLLDGEENYVEKEIRLIKEEIGENILKVIFENCYLSKEQIKIASQLAVEAGADFVKTSTGFGTGGATFKDVAIMDSVVDGKAQIKAAGGIRDIETAKRYIEMGVTRLGTSSGVSLVTSGISDKNQY
ncbi:deoxyribose-phosphate aldolase [Tenacibaculum mesophilum]|uniref:Deoxyribose-phosphate aldolase n=1 Tax=Tenacibaculum mesophilum TaxID=104268 RepID=A0ABN5T512_9FLAO|nr:deoxyribose-phosphate aldolase [Tenacibaculum mesophilum]AZJ32323.1 deoxyribose-phosphate aldolase [Tenacibaculum mesophilum]QFS27579.1 deoxyribose-phosphate aldolase [Tenacibaculum mesophilum]SHG11843.1 deoxyribose-phosphate aldolase [Tenacibaculum mesophilum]